MGIDYAAAIWVGLPRKEFADREKLSDLVESDTLETCPPYYDGYGSEGAIIGYSVQVSPDYGPVELAFDEAKVAERKREFQELTGQEAKVYLSPYGT